MEELCEGTGGGEIGSVSAGVGIAALAANCAAFVPDGERPLRAVAHPRLDIFLGPGPDAGGVQCPPKIYPVLGVGIEKGFLGPRIGCRSGAVLKLTVVELDFVALREETADVEVQLGGEVVRAFGSVFGHRKNAFMLGPTKNPNLTAGNPGITARHVEFLRYPPPIRPS